MSTHNDQPLADLSTRLRQGPLRSSPFEYRRASFIQSEAPDYTARPMPSPAAPRSAQAQQTASPQSAPAQPSTSPHREPLGAAAGVPPGSRKGVEASTSRDDARLRAPNEWA